jgi:serine phosphatase RsbU (regulator of sigma subunit)
MPRLHFLNGSNAGKSFEFSGDVLIGRGSLSDVPLRDSNISRRHAMIQAHGASFSVTDLESQNGTFVNGSRVESATRLRDGDELGLGAVRCRFSDEVPGVISQQVPKVALRSDGEPDAADGPSVLDSVQAGEQVPVASETEAGLRRRLQVLYEIGEAVAQTLDEEKLLSLIMRKLFDVFPQAERGFIMLEAEGAEELVPRVARSRSGEVKEIAVSRTVVREAMTHRRAILTSDAASDVRYVDSGTIMSLGLRSVLCAPILAGDEVYGVIHLDGSDPNRPFVKADMYLLLAIASHLALSLANARMHIRVLMQERVEQDLVLATKIQNQFLPQSTPEVAGYEFADEYSSAQEVGGDYYDFLEMGEGHIGVAVGDVCGKGIGAALYMARLSSEMRFTAAGRTEPSEVLTRLNHSFCQNLAEGMFVTLVLMALDPSRGTLKIASAGHLPPLLRRIPREVRELELPPNLPIGIDEDFEYEQVELPLEPGDCVAAFTDGITEATNPVEDEFGDERLEAAIRDSDGTARGVLDSALGAVKAFIAGSPPSDDITLVSLGRRRLG